MKRTAYSVGFVLLLLLAGCAAHRAIITMAQDRLSMDQLAADIATLASDEFEGRLPGTPGGKKTIAYLEQRYEELGLEPGNGDSYLQDVPLLKAHIDAGSSITIKGDGAEQKLHFRHDFAVWYSAMKDKLSLEDVELVFVGYGAVDPDYDWDDYEGIDVGGKVVVILREDPGYISDDITFFLGKLETPSSLFRTKYRLATEQGAAGALVIIDTAMSTSKATWEEVSRYMIRPRTSLLSEEADTSRAVMNGFLEVNAGRALLAQAGHSYDSLLVAASKRGFKSFSLGLNLSASLQKHTDPFTSYNVLGRLSGRERPDELVIYNAHWDHIGRDTTLSGDQIYNGAVDNASGTAALLSLAELFTGLEKRPERSILFMAVTAEESGLLGSRYYTEHPLYPPTKTAAVINVDILLPFGKSRDVIVIGSGKSQLDEYIEAAAKRLDLAVQADMWPQERFYYRSDHINFARKGIPSSLMVTGVNNVPHGEDWGLAQFNNYLKEIYHTPSDEYDDSWDLAGAVDVLMILFDMGYTISNQRRFPNWYQEDEFRPVRDAAMEAAGNRPTDSQ